MTSQNKPSWTSRGEEFYPGLFCESARQCERGEVVPTEPVPALKISCLFVFECVVPSSAVICILIECELCCLSCIILNIVCRMDLIDSATALNIKRAQHQHIRIIHSGNRGLQDHQMNIKPLIKARLWHDTLPRSWAASDNENTLGYDEKCWRGLVVVNACVFYSWDRFSSEMQHKFRVSFGFGGHAQCWWSKQVEDVKEKSWIF